MSGIWNNGNGNNGNNGYKFCIFFTQNKIRKIREVMLDYDFDVNTIKKVVDNYENLRDRFNNEMINVNL